MKKNRRHKARYFCCLSPVTDGERQFINLPDIFNLNFARVHYFRRQNQVILYDCLNRRNLNRTNWFTDVIGKNT